MKQRTLKNDITVSGIGLHTGKTCTAVLSPAKENTGIVFVRDNIRIPATIDYVTSTCYCTTITNQGVSVKTIEHFMATLYAYSIDNCEIHVTSEELPIFDGSGMFLSQKIKETGVVHQNDDAEYIDLSIKHLLDTEDGHYVIVPYDRLYLRVMTVFNQYVNQCSIVITPRNYDVMLSPARTFIHEKDIENVRRMGIIKGGSEDNALILDEHNESRQTMRFLNEPTRHKMLDMLGDIALIGKRTRGMIYAYKPGHTSNVALVRSVLKRKEVIES